ncbi:MAG: helix-turn-helix domain-containing protein [Rickettsiales bacterium]|jgi:cytoskeletal protein RodZ|nr:helix-turn-helix domain-containing protein [Rickettsiales bacterium]
MIELGKIIQDKRIERSLKIKDVANDLKISKRYLRAIEDDQVDIFAAESYYYGYLKQYLKYLGLKDIDIKPVSKNPDLNTSEPVITNSKPSILLVIFSIILSIVIYIICNALIEQNLVDHISLELENNTSKFAKIN